MKEFFGKEPHKGINPDEVVADRRRHPGRRAQGRGEGRPPARRDAAVARRRDRRRRVHQDHRQEHHHPLQEGAGLLHRGRQPAAGERARPPGRARDGRGQQDAGALRAGRHPARAARRAADRGHLRHRRQRHRARVSAKDLGTGKQQAVRVVSQLRPHRAGDPADDRRRRSRTQSDDKKKKELADLRNNADGLIYTTEKSLEEYATLLTDEGHGGDQGRPGEPQGASSKPRTR